MSDIRPCPFCGSDNARVERDGSDGVSFYVICNECLSQGPCSLASEDDALGRWNERWTLTLWEPRSQKRLRGLLRDVDDGLDDYWITTKEGVEWICRRCEALGE